MGQRTRAPAPLLALIYFLALNPTPFLTFVTAELFSVSITVDAYTTKASPLELVEGMGLLVTFALEASRDWGSAVCLFPLLLPMTHYSPSSFPYSHLWKASVFGGMLD